MKKKVIGAVALSALVALQMPMVALAYGTVEQIEAGKYYERSSTGDELAQNYSVASGGSVIMNEQGYTVITNSSTGGNDLTPQGGAGPYHYETSYGVDTNEGTIKTNDGSVCSNNGVIETNTSTGQVDFNNPIGEIVTNIGTINYNLGKIETNNGVIGSMYDGSTGNLGTVVTNNNTIWKNKGTVNENSAGAKVNDNDNLVEINDGTICQNGSGDALSSRVGINNGIIERNVTNVGINNGTIKSSFMLGIVEVNNGTIENNYGKVEQNSVSGNVTLGSIAGYDGMVLENEGVVINGILNEDGSIAYAENGKTYYGVTYKDGDAKLGNTSVEAGTKITIEKAQAKAGYNFVRWTVTTPAGEQSYCYFGGEQIDVTDPLLLQAIYEAYKTEEKKASFTGNADSAVANGQWNCSPGGLWTYRTDGIFKNTWGNITLENGRTGWFWFDKDGIMATGWKEINGKWYYFNEAHDGSYGMMLTNTTTPDGKKVGADGALIQ